MDKGFGFFSNVQIIQAYANVVINLLLHNVLKWSDTL